MESSRDIDHANVPKCESQDEDMPLKRLIARARGAGLTDPQAGHEPGTPGCKAAVDALLSLRTLLSGSCIGIC